MVGIGFWKFDWVGVQKADGMHRVSLAAEPGGQASGRIPAVRVEEVGSGAIHEHSAHGRDQGALLGHRASGRHMRQPEECQQKGQAYMCGRLKKACTAPERRHNIGRGKARRPCGSSASPLARCRPATSSTTFGRPAAWSTATTTPLWGKGENLKAISKRIVGLFKVKVAWTGGARRSPSSEPGHSVDWTRQHVRCRQVGGGAPAREKVGRRHGGDQGVPEGAPEQESRTGEGATPGQRWANRCWPRGRGGGRARPIPPPRSMSTGSCW